MSTLKLQQDLPLLLYVLGGFFGFTCGVLYGLDGWRGSAKDSALKNTARVKNLLWLLGAGSMAFLGDIHKISDSADKSVLAVIYYLSAFAGGGLTVAFFAILTVAATRRRLVHYSWVDALGDYLRFGYDFVRKQLDRHSLDEEQAGRSSEELARYLRQLTTSIAIAGSTVEKMDHRLEIAGRLLDAVTATVHSLNPKLKTVRTNFMCIVPCSEKNRSKLRFTDDASSVKLCLQLTIYDGGAVPTDFHLPLTEGSEPNATALPGAPEAFARNSPIVIDDTWQLDLSHGIPAKVRKDMKAYFRQQNFRSFASLPVTALGRTIGVLNVESQEPQIFGASREQKEKISLHIYPLCSALGVLLRS